MNYKIKLLALLFISTAMTAFSQEVLNDNAKKKLFTKPSLVIDFGMGTYKVSTNSVSNTAISNLETKKGLHFNLSAGVRFDFNNKFYFQPSLGYSQKQYDFKFISKADNVLYPFGFSDISLYYFDMPILFGYKIITYKDFNIWCSLGPVVSVLMSEDISYHRAGGIDDNKSTAVTEVDFERSLFNISGECSVGLEYYKLRLSVSYIYENSSSSDYFGTSKSFLTTVGFIIN